MDGECYYNGTEHKYSIKVRKDAVFKILVIRILPPVYCRKEIPGLIIRYSLLQRMYSTVLSLMECILYFYGTSLIWINILPLIFDKMLRRALYVFKTCSSLKVAAISRRKMS
jgi:hypothetical protein